MSTDPINSYHHGDLKAALVKAAERLIANKGIDALSLRSIATKAGVSHMAPYAHFKNKSELFKSVAASGYVKLTNRLKRIKKSADKSDDLVLLYGMAYIEFATKNPQLYKLMLRQTHPDLSTNKKTTKKPVLLTLSNGDKSLRDASKKTYLLLRDCFVDSANDEHEASVQAQGAWALVHGVASLLITGQIVIDPKSSLREFLETVTKGLSS